MRSLKDQLQVISDVLDDAADDARESDKDDLWSDVSEEEIYQTTVGKAEGCINNGVVEGDINAGGVARSPWLWKVCWIRRRTLSGSGTIPSLSLRNPGDSVKRENRVPVTSKKDYAGGIVGRMDLGYILDCLELRKCGEH